MTSDPWVELGYAIRKARLELGWSLEKLAADALGNGARKGYVGQVEKGRRNLAPETIDKFDQALDLPAEIVKAAQIAPPPADRKPDEEKRDFDAERLLKRVAKDDAAPSVAEALLTTLAYEFAGGKFQDLETSYIGLRKALEAAENIRKRGEMPPDNTGNQLNAVMAEVSRLNDLGDLDAANDLLDAEERRMFEAHKAEKDRQEEAERQMLNQRLDQDRLRNDPAAAADRLIRNLMRQAPAGGVYWATRELIIEWRERGATQGDPFDLRVALVLANRNFERAKKPQKGLALLSLGNCRLSIGERGADLDMLLSAEKTMRTAIKAISKSSDLRNWTAAQSSLGIAAYRIGERTKDAEKVREAIAAHRAALVVNDKDADPEKWGIDKSNLGVALQSLGELEREETHMREAVAALTDGLSVRDKEETPELWTASQNNLGVVHRWLGTITGNIAEFDRAADHYDACLTVRNKTEVSFDWAITQWNLADLALARHDVDPDPGLLDTAEHHANAA